MTSGAGVTPGGLPAAFWDRYAFSVGDAHFQWIDIALAAMARGEWSAFERRLAEGVACAARADLERAWPSRQAVDEAATAFRYERDLIAAADVDAWLERAGITVDDWLAYLGRDLLRRRWRDELDDVLDRFPPSPKQLAAVAVAEGVCSGTFDAFERDCGARAALVLGEDPATSLRAATSPEPFASPAARLAHTHGHWLSMRPEADTAGRLITILQLEAAFTSLTERAVSNGRLGAFLDANRLDWIQIELDTVSFATADAAREALLCVKEDGLSLHDVAGLARQRVERRSCLLEEIDPDHRERLLAAEPGTVLGPLAVDGRFQVTAVIRRTTPALTDARVAARARQALVESLLVRAAREHVRRRPPQR